MPLTKQEYAEYEEAVKQFFKDNGINCLSQRPSEDKEEAYDEPYVSSRMCDCCKDTQQGMRVDACGYNPTTDKIIDFIVCEDCLYYAEYGQLPDAMMPVD